MPTIDVVKSEFVTLQYLPEKKLLHHTIHKPVDEAVFKNVLNAGVDLLSKHSIQKWLSDDRKNGPFSQDFSEWAVKDWIPRSITAGWRFWANVVPEDLKAAGTLIPFIEILHNQGLRMMVFSQPDEAMKWLEHVS